jgi:peptidoglycan/xylan/chitin deacetylase (PgdA/CDA1 family)
MKRSLLKIMTSEAVMPFLRPLSRGIATIFMMHRFEDRELGVAGHDAEGLRAHLAYLRRERYALVSVADLVQTVLERGALPSRAVAFTVDDGYADFHRIAAPIFAEFDCPVTLFIASGFVDGQVWCWWDKIEHALVQTARSGLRFASRGTPLSYDWAGPADRKAAAADVTERLKWLPERERNAAITAIAEILEVSLSPRPPPAFAPMSWHQVRAWSRRGVTFGPHSVSHPILSLVDDRRAAFEIAESWRRVREETDAAIPVFCYPQGNERSFSSRDAALIRREGLIAALTAMPGHVTTPACRRSDADGRYTMPRFTYCDDRAQFVQIVSGLERLKRELRDRWRP